MAILWSEKLSVGVKEIDDQHKKFIEIMNEMYAAINISDKQKIKELLKKLTEYAELHFATEEKYFDLFKYENSDEHKQLHKEMIVKVLEFENRYETEELNILLELLDFLENWLTDHLENQDQKYVQCFHDNGLE